MESTNQENSATNSLHFLDYWRVIKSRKEIILAVALLVIVAGVAYTLTLPNMFRSSALIKVNAEQVDMDPFSGQMLGSGYDPYFLRTQFTIIQSRPIAERVVERLNLQKVWGKGGQDLPLEAAINVLRRSLSVNQSRDTSLVSISASSKAPDEAARIANEVAEAYKQLRLDVKQEELRRGLSDLERELKVQQGKVDAAELALEKIRSDLDITMLSAGLTIDTASIQQMVSSRDNAQVEMLVKKSQMDSLDPLEGDELVAALDFIIGNAYIQSLRAQILDTDVSLKLMLENYGSNHPEVKKLEAGNKELTEKLAKALTGVKEGLKIDYDGAKTRFEALDSQLSRLGALEKDTQRDRLLPFNKATRELETQQSILDAMKSRVTQEGITFKMSRTPVEVIEAAVPIGRPYSPNFFMNVMLSVVLGLGAGVGLAYFIEYLDTSVKTAEDIERYVGLPVLGLIPQKVRPLIEEGAESEHAEAYRVLRTNLSFANNGTSHGSYIMASGGAGEGKSTTIFNLAYVCAQRGEKVLLIDADMRRPVQHKILDMDNRFGLTNVLLRDAPVEETIKPTTVPNLHFLPSGRLPRTSMGLLETNRIKELVRSLRNRYDVILIDCPPVIGISDASILASAVDGAIMVVQYRKYPRDMAVKTKHLLDLTGAKTMGVVLNNINVMRDDYYYYYHSYYYNSYYRPQQESMSSDQA
jgi:capsular exopolysaccharide synthesis family protein